MKFQRVFSLAKKDLKKMVREPALLFMTLLFPIILTLLFGVSFGSIGGTQTPTYVIGVINLNSVGSYEHWAEYFVGNLTNVEILSIQVFPDNDTAQVDLAQGKIQAVLVIPNDFGESCYSFWESPTNASNWLNTTLHLSLDSGSLFATQAIPPIIGQVLSASVYGEQPTGIQRPIQIGSPSMVQAGKTTMFDFMAPGIFAFASIFLTLSVAESFAGDREKGLLRRINITPTTPTEFMTGQVISNMTVALIQVALVFVMAFVVGYRPSVSLANLVLAFIIMAIFALCNVGFGLVAATLAKSSGAATGISFIFIMPQMFLGTFVGAGLAPSAQAIGKFVPSYYVTDALTSLFLRGAPVTSPTVMLDLAVVIIVSVLAFLSGIVLFRKYGKA